MRYFHFRELTIGFCSHFYKKHIQVMMSIDILHRSEADAAPAGTGRAEPNAHPVLPEPEGRIDFTKMWNPLYMCRWVSITSDWVYCSCSKFVVFISHCLVVDIIYNVYSLRVGYALVTRSSRSWPAPSRASWSSLYITSSASLSSR